MNASDRRLMWHGMFLFLLGLITGLVEQRFTNMASSEPLSFVIDSEACPT